MWSAQVSRRDVFELFLGSTKAVDGRVREAAQVNVDAGNEVLLVWDCDPAHRFVLPTLVIVADGDVQGVLSAIAAAPQAPSPMTALSRVLTREEAKQHFDSDALPINERVFPALAALVFVEAVLHGDGRLGLKQLTPLICKRTLSFAWGRSLAARVGAESFLELPGRWLEVYSLLNSPPASDAAQNAVDSIVGALSLLTQIAHGLRPDTATGSLAFELLNGARDQQERAWQRLATRLPRLVGIETLQSFTREERGSYLQEALRFLSSTGERSEQEDVIVACAFLATRLAPGSLEHLEVLRGAKRPELLAWYALFAALQHPKEILSLFGGLGFRLSRDILRTEEKLAPPVADISYAELRMLARGGLESMTGRLGHASELQVELIPYVSTSFTFQPKNRLRWAEGQQSLDIEQSEPPISPRARVARLAAELAELARNLPDVQHEYSPARKSRRKE